MHFGNGPFFELCASYLTGRCSYGSEMNAKMTKGHSIRDLVERAQNGDRSACERLFGLYRQRLEGLVGSRLGAELRKCVEVEDVLQETLLQAFQSIRRFEWRGEESFFRWLGGIVEHQILNEVRTRRRDGKVGFELDVLRDDTSPSKGVRRDERFSRLQESLESLSPERREVILLARIEGLQIKEIARRWNRSPDAVAHLLFRALRKLKESFGDTESLHLPPRALTDPRDPDHDE